MMVMMEQEQKVKKKRKKYEVGGGTKQFSDGPHDYVTATSMNFYHKV